MFRATHGLPTVWGTGAPWVTLPGPTSVPSDAQEGWHREQNANPVRAVGASPVVLPSFANVFVILVSVTCWNTYTPARREALYCELILVSNCLTPYFNCLLITSCSLNCSSAHVLRWSWLEPSALFFVELWPFSQQPPSRLPLLQSFWLPQRPGTVELLAAPPVVSVFLLLKRFLDGLHLVLETRQISVPLWLSSSSSASE